MNIAWLVNGTSSTHDDIIKLGIVTNGVPQHSNLTIHGYPQYNNTLVRCDAFESVIGYFNFSQSTLKIQGNKLPDICHYISSY